MAPRDPPEPRAGYSRSQRHDVTLLAVLRGGSFLGDSVALVALYLRVAPLGHSWAIATLAVAGSLPLVLLAPLAGHVVDRVRARPLLSALGFVEGVICVGLGYWHGLAVTIGLMGTLSVAIAFSMPGYGALAPSVVGDANVARVQGLLQAVQGVASVAGPALGGLLVGTAGQSWPLYLDAASFVFAGVLTTLVHHDRRPSATSALARATSDALLGGITHVWRDDVLRPLLVNIVVFMLAIGMVNVAEVFFVTRTLHASALAYGLVGTSFGLGTVAGALGAGRLRQGPMNLATSLSVAVIAIGVALGAVGLVTRVNLVYPLLLVAGVALGVANVAALTLFTLRTPEHLRGRMFAALNAATSGAEIFSMAAGGAILVLVAPRTVFQIGGAAATLSALILGPFALRASRRAHSLETANDATGHHTR
ncbi:MAG: MFS transporter [Acidimicrobiales bacterium]